MNHLKVLVKEGVLPKPYREIGYLTGKKHMNLFYYNKIHAARERVKDYVLLSPEEDNKIFSHTNTHTVVPTLK